MNGSASRPAGPLRDVIFERVSKGMTPPVILSVFCSDEPQKCAQIQGALDALHIPYETPSYPFDREQRHPVRIQIAGDADIEKFKKAGGVLSEKRALSHFTFRKPLGSEPQYVGNKPEMLKPILKRLGIRFKEDKGVITIPDEASMKAIILSGGISRCMMSDGSTERDVREAFQRG